jgi:hypothetical protein
MSVTSSGVFHCSALSVRRIATKYTNFSLQFVALCKTQKEVALSKFRSTFVPA